MYSELNFRLPNNFSEFYEFMQCTRFVYNRLYCEVSNEIETLYLGYCKFYVCVKEGCRASCVDNASEIACGHSSAEEYSTLEFLYLLSVHDVKPLPNGEVEFSLRMPPIVEYRHSTLSWEPHVTWCGFEVDTVMMMYYFNWREDLPCDEEMAKVIVEFVRDKVVRHGFNRWVELWEFAKIHESPNLQALATNKLISNKDYEALRKLANK